MDVPALVAPWDTNPGHPADFDGDGTVGILDLLTLLANWGLSIASDNAVVAHRTDAVTNGRKVRRAAT